MFDKIIDTKYANLSTHVSNYAVVDWHDLAHNRYIIKDGSTDIQSDAPSNYQWVKIGEVTMSGNAAQDDSTWAEGALSESCELQEGEALGLIGTVYLKNATDYSENYRDFNIKKVASPIAGSIYVTLPSATMAARQAFVNAGGYVKFNYIPDTTNNKIDGHTGGIRVGINPTTSYYYRTTNPISGYQYNNGSSQSTYCEWCQGINFQTGDLVLTGRIYMEYNNVPGDTRTHYGRSNSVSTVTIEVYKYKEIQAPTPVSYVLFSSPSNNISLNVIDNLKYWDGTIETSPDNTTWTLWDGTTTVSSNTGKIYVRGSNNTYITGSTASASSSKGYWQLTGTDITVSGNIECLLDYQTVTGGGMIASPADYTFAYLFAKNNNIISAQNLELPRTTLVTFCYRSMFYDCTSLVSTPTLPATTLADSCYYAMFSGCTSLTATPSLPATTLADSCYYAMFNNCTNLVTATALPATTLTFSCYRNMFRSCSSLTTLISLPATTLAARCYYEMFRYCSNIKLSTTQTGDYVNEYRIPTTGTGTAETTSLTYMFNNTGGTFITSPTINTTYYTSNTVIDPE